MVNHFDKLSMLNVLVHESLEMIRGDCFALSLAVGKNGKISNWVPSAPRYPQVASHKLGHCLFSGCQSGRDKIPISTFARESAD